MDRRLRQQIIALIREYGGGGGVTGSYDALGAASAAQAGAQSYAAGLVDDLSGVTDPATARTNLGLSVNLTSVLPTSEVYLSDPQPVVIASGTVTPVTSSVLIRVALNHRTEGSAYGMWQLWWCDATLGRWPHPTTQDEATTSIPAGITVDRVGTATPASIVASKGSFVGMQGAEQGGSAIVKKTGLTPGHTYRWELCAGIVGAATDAAPMDANTSGRPAVIRTKGLHSHWKVYQASDTGNRVDSAVLPAMFPMVNGQLYKSGSIGAGGDVKDIVANQNQSLLAILTAAPSIRLIDPVWDLITATYTPSVSPVRGALTPDGSVLAFIGGTSLYLMNTSTGSFSAATSTTATGVDVKFSPDLSSIWVLGSNGTLRGWNYAGSGTTVGSAIGTITLPSNPAAVTASCFCIGNTGTAAWIADDTNGKCTQVSLTGLSVTRSITIPAAGPFVGAEFFNGDIDRGLLIISRDAGTGNKRVHQVNVTDWTIYTSWVNHLAAGPAGATDANATAGGLAITGDGGIFVSDVANNAVNYWNGARVAILNNNFLTRDYVSVETQDAI